MRETSAVAGGAEQAWLDKRVAGWALYDVASSAYVAIVPLLFPLLYANVVLQGAAGADARYAALGAIALATAGIFTPLIGALADRGKLLPWLAAATILCIGACLTMPALGAGQVLLASLAFIAAQSGYTIAMALYESYLPRLASPQAMARVSAFGWAAGLAGGVVALAIAWVLVRGKPEAEGAATAIQVAAAVFATFAIPAFFALRRFASRAKAPLRGGGGAAWRTLVADLRDWRRHRNSLRFLVAFLLINDAAVTIVLVVTLFLRQTFGTSLERLLELLILYSVLAAPATLAWGWVAGHIGLVRAIHLNLLVWAGGILMMIFARGEHAPWLITCTLAMVIASTNALCRALYARLVPVERSAQFFGFNAVVGRMSAAIGPTTYAIIVGATGNPNAGLFALLAFIVVGGLVLATVDGAPPVRSLPLPERAAP